MNVLKQIAALLLAALLPLLLAGCGAQEQEEPAQSGSSSTISEELPQEEEEASDTTPERQPFTLGYYSGVGFHPYTCENTQNQNIACLLYDTLVELDEQFEPQPGLATDITCQVTKVGGDTTAPAEGSTSAAAPEQSEQASELETTVTITLRTDVTFQDGSTMTAKDVVYSIQQAMKEGSIYAARLSDVQSVKASGNRKVVLTVAGAAAAFDRRLDIPIVKQGTAGQSTPMGTGAYCLKLDESGNPDRLVRNSSWWKEQTPLLEEIPLYGAKDSDYLLYGFGGGEISLVTTDLIGSNSLGYSGNFQVVDYSTTTMLYLGCNTAEGACRSAKVRSALYYAIDRSTLASKILSGHAQATSLPMNPSAAEYDAELAKELGQDLERARALLPSSTSKLTLIVNADSTFKVAVAKELQEQLTQLGLSVTLSELSWSDFKSAIEAGEYDLYLGEVRMTADFALDAFLAEEGVLNWSGYANDDLTALMTAFDRAAGEERQTAAAALDRALAEEAPFIPLCFKSGSVLYQWNTLNHLTPTQQNPFYQFESWSFVGEE
jgi:peptide/nickel transport system substrate-binding protein